MKSCIFHPDAEQEFEEAVDYYESKRTGLGLEFKDEVQEAVLRIQQFPAAKPIYKDTLFRKFVLDRFPYSLFYLEEDNRIWIAAVAHHKRKPGYWLGRRLED